MLPKVFGAKKLPVWVSEVALTLTYRQTNRTQNYKNGGQKTCPPTWLG
jgi:hypothetical protein